MIVAGPADGLEGADTIAVRCAHPDHYRIPVPYFVSLGTAGDTRQPRELGDGLEGVAVAQTVVSATGAAQLILRL